MNSERAVSDRFLIALLIASLVHAFLILGLTFEMPKPVNEIGRTLSVTLVTAPAREAPKKPDVLAQENQVGGGQAEKRAVPRAVPPPPPKPRPVPIEKHVEKRHAPVPEPIREAKRKPVLVAEKAEKKVVVDAGEEEEPKPELPKLSAALLSQQITEVSTSLANTPDTEAPEPRRLHINSVNAHKYKAAAYEHDWQQKIERVGNLNYPDEARRQNLSGALVMAVHVRPDGSVEKIDIRQPSDYPVLDEAAERIVRLAEPFAPFPAELKQQADILVITRTWRFYNDSTMDTH
jgi:protein TonB